LDNHSLFKYLLKIYILLTWLKSLQVDFLSCIDLEFEHIQVGPS